MSSLKKKIRALLNKLLDEFMEAVGYNKESAAASIEAEAAAEEAEKAAPAAETPVKVSKVPTWKETTKASCWFGSNANHRIMNILSPKMSESTFEARFKESEARGVNTFHLILVNKGDGEAAGYTALNVQDVKTMDKRIKYIRSKGHAIVLWCMTDDSSEWAKNLDMNHLMTICESWGWLSEASAIVVGLECDEYWSTSQIKKHIETIRKHYKGAVGVHFTSGKTDALNADILYYQTAPGKSASQIKKEVADAVKKSHKPVCMFELSRHEDRNLCNAAFEGGAFAVGNW